LNIYHEANRLAEEAAKSDVRKGQLEQLARYAETHDKEGILFWIRKQVTRESGGRPLLSLDFASKLEDLLGRAVPRIFSKIVGVAADYLDWKLREKDIEIVGRRRGEIDKVVREQLSLRRLRFGGSKLFMDRDGFRLSVNVEGRVPDRGRLASEIVGEVKRRVPELRYVNLKVWFE
jgi:hypothetical protein